jgi:uncharacterized membrane protein YheB (UPF0754 family)
MLFYQKHFSLQPQIAMMNWTYVLIPAIAAAAGWMISRLTIKMLLDGIIRNRQQIAERLGQLVSKELLSFNDIEQKITHPDNIKKILPHVEQHIDEFLRQRLKEVFPMISMFIGDKTINQLKEVFMKELENLFPVVMNNYMNNLKQDLDLERIVVDKVLAFPPGQNRSGVYQSLAKEFRLLSLVCAGVGLLTGLVQVLLVIILKG